MRHPRTIAGRVVFAVSIAVWSVHPGMAQEPLRIGLITVHTGPLAGPGKQLENGLGLFLEQRHQTIAGRPVELVVVDSAGSPATAKLKAQELVERYHVDVIAGPLASNEALTVLDYVRDAQVPLVSASALEEDMTQRKSTPWAVRATSTAAQMTHPFGDYAAKTLKYERIATISTDFAFGHATVAGFLRTFEEDGGAIVKKIWVPTNAVDFGTYIAQIPADVDAVFASFSGASAQNFIRQYNEFGKKAQTPLLVSHATVDESLIQDMGDDAAGVISSAQYAATIDNPANRAFVAAYKGRYGVDPGFYSTGAYVAGLFIEAALVKTGGDVDKAKFMAALRETRLETSPRGPISLDKYGNTICDIVIRKTERVGGRMQNTIVATYPQVSQFWTYDPAKFLADPVYSRDFPPAKNAK